MFQFFSIDNIAFTLGGYAVSYTELIGTLLCLWATILSAQRNVYTWLVNMAGVVFFSILFYQLRLYSDLILQVYYFTLGLLGWFWWKRKSSHAHILVSKMDLTPAKWVLYVATLVLIVVITGFLVSNFHHWMPDLFPREAAWPYSDSAVLILSIVGTFLMARRKMENWYIWIVSNALAATIYGLQNSLLLCIEFIIFWFIGVWGWYNWHLELKRQLPAVK